MDLFWRYRPGLVFLICHGEELWRSALVNLRWSLSQLSDLIERCFLARNTPYGHLVSELWPLIRIYRPKWGFHRGWSQMSSFLGEGVCPVEGGSGSQPSLPWWGAGGEGGLMHPGPYHLPFLEKGLGTLALAVWFLGPRSSSSITSLVPGSFACVYLFLVVVLDRCNRQGPIKNRHPRATH